MRQNYKKRDARGRASGRKEPFWAKIEARAICNREFVNLIQSGWSPSGLVQADVVHVQQSPLVV